MNDENGPLVDNDFDDPFGEGPQPEPELPDTVCPTCGRETPTSQKECIHCGDDGNQNDDMGSRDIDREEGYYR